MKLGDWERRYGMGASDGRFRGVQQAWLCECSDFAGIPPFWVINRCVFTVGKTRGQVKESDIHASYKDGTLCLQVPKAEAQPQVESKHQIAIED